MSKLTDNFVINRNADICGISIRAMTKADLSQVIEQRKYLEFQDVRSAFLTWLTVEPKGIQIAENEKGEIIGSCGCVNLNNLYYLGLYHVIEKYRGYGIGLQLWNACMQYIGQDNAGLCTSLEKAKIYRDKSGFSTLETDFTIFANLTKKQVNPEVLSTNLPQGVSIQPFNKSHLPHIFAYDFALMGYKRERILELSCQEEESSTLVAFKNRVCVGFGTIKTTSLGGGRVGPLYADDSSVAEVMLRNLIVSLPHVNSFAMMTMSTNVPVRQFLQKLDCPQVVELVQLYKKERLSVNSRKIFALFDVTFQPF